MQLLVWDTDSDDWKVCELTNALWGDRRHTSLVPGWWRIARGLRSICRNVLQLIIFYYVDDTHLVERGRTATSGKEAFQRLMKLLGWELDPVKSTNMCTQVTSLGCSLTITKDDVRWALTPAKRDRWREDIMRALQTNQLSSADASKLHGRLNFGSQRVFGRVGRARSPSNLLSTNAAQHTPTWSVTWRTPQECIDLVGPLPGQLATRNQNSG